MSAARVVQITVESLIESPHVVYPKGPIRKIKTFRAVEDQVAGHIALVTLECEHEASLVGPGLNIHSIVRCPICFFDKRR